MWWLELICTENSPQASIFSTAQISILETLGSHSQSKGNFSASRFLSEFPPTKQRRLWRCQHPLQSQWMLRLCLQRILDNLSSVNDQYRLWGKGTIKMKDTTAEMKINNGILLSHINEWNNAICHIMDGRRDYHTKWNRSNRERHISYDITYIWNLK